MPAFMGVGAFFDNKVYAFSLYCINESLSIVHLEMINVLVAIRCWRHLLCNSTVDIHCDNATVVAALTSYKIKDSFLLCCARNIWFELATANIQLNIKHIRGANNKYADILSRWDARRQI